MALNFDDIRNLKILVGVNVLTAVDSEIYGSHCNFWYYNGVKHPTWKFFKYHPRRMSIDRMRNTAAEIALEQECDYLLFIDDDVMIEKDVLDSLLKADKDIVMALTFIRGYPFAPMLFKYVTQEGNANKVLDNHFDFEKDIDENGLVQCDAVGFSCALIKCSLLKKVYKPYFVTGSLNTEDIYFCLKAKLEHPETTIFTDTKSPTKHLLDKFWIGWDTRKDLKNFYEEALGCKDEKSEGFDPVYIEKALNQFNIRKPDKTAIPIVLSESIGVGDET